MYIAWSTLSMCVSIRTCHPCSFSFARYRSWLLFRRPLVNWNPYKAISLHECNHLVLANSTRMAKPPALISRPTTKVHCCLVRFTGIRITDKNYGFAQQCSAEYHDNCNCNNAHTEGNIKVGYHRNKTKEHGERTSSSGLMILCLFLYQTYEDWPKSVFKSDQVNQLINNFTVVGRLPTCIPYNWFLMMYDCFIINANELRIA